MSRPRIVLVLGTRPDAIKTLPVYLELKRYESAIEPVLLSTGQHREMLDQVFATFDVQPDRDLNIMQPGQTLAQVTARAMEGLDAAIQDYNPAFLMGQGDTTTTFVASLAAFYRRVPFGHIEAGLRTGVIDDPFPEEFNRMASALVATQHYAPTSVSRDNLVREHVPADRIFVTGNTALDSIVITAQKLPQTWLPDWPGRVILVTTHRRENWGERQADIARALRRITEAFDDVRIVVAMHRNPIVREVLVRELGGVDRRIDLIEPPDYAPFVKLMERSTFILTDSGGVQEEAPTLAKPVLVLRETTERPEGVASGNSKLVGTDPEAIFAESSRLLTDESAFAAMAHASSPFGDGRAAQRIRYVALRSLGIETPPESDWTESVPTNKMVP